MTLLSDVRAFNTLGVDYDFISAQNLWVLWGDWDHGWTIGEPWDLAGLLGWDPAVLAEHQLRHHLGAGFRWIPLDSAGFGFHWMIDEGKVCGWFLLVCCCFRITRYIKIYQDEVIQCQIEVVRQFSSRRMAPYALLHCFVETSWRFHKSSGPTAIGWSLWYELNRIKLKWTCALGEHSHSNICNGR